MHFVDAAIARLDGAARSRVLRLAGIPQAIVTVAHARVPAQAFSALWLAVSHELDDEFFGLDPRRMKVGSFALLCRALLAEADLNRAVRQMLRGYRVFLDEVHADLSLTKETATISICNRLADPAARRFADETLLVMVHGLMCWLAGRRIPLADAEFGFPRPVHAHEYTLMFSEHLRFGAKSTSIRFDSRALDLPVVQGPASLKAFLRTAPQSVFLKYSNEDSLTAKLRRRLRRYVGEADWPVLEQIADQFHVSVPTLRRRLKAEFTSYQDIKDEVRRDAAIHYLCTTSRSIDEVSWLVGFREVSAFRRAFKAWSGVRPGEYRRQKGRASQALSR